mmetsp:Transcript_19902/g.28608  ORF Transcript_19902/g.28608 Transcript_19902/m.28608 type:complete len:226 (+) Transcript_19902:109-786(+)
MRWGPVTTEVYAAYVICVSAHSCKHSRARYVRVKRIVWCAQRTVTIRMRVFQYGERTLGRSSFLIINLECFFHDRITRQRWTPFGSVSAVLVEFGREMLKHLVAMYHQSMTVRCAASVSSIRGCSPPSSGCTRRPSTTHTFALEERRDSKDTQCANSAENGTTTKSSYSLIFRRTISLVIYAKRVVSVSNIIVITTAWKHISARPTTYVRNPHAYRKSSLYLETL